MSEELILVEDISLAEVGEVIADAAQEIIPPNAMEKLEAFFETPHGHVIVHAVIVALIILVTFITIKIINRTFYSAIKRLKAAKNPNAAVVAFMRYAVVFIVDLIALLSIVASVPALSTIFNSLLTAGGAMAIIVGIAAQDALGSVASGIMILVFKPFIIGDLVNIASMSVVGTVEDITLRHTVVKTFENKRVIIPNSEMSAAVVENFDYVDKKVCMMVDFHITYDSDVEKAIALLAEEAGKHPNFQDVRTPEQKTAGDPRVVVRVQELGQSAVTLRVWLWGADNGSAYCMKCDLNRFIKKRFDEEGIIFAYPRVGIVSGR